MKTYIVNNEKYVSCRELTKAFGFTNGITNYYGNKDSFIKENIITNYTPHEGGKAISIINKNGVNRLLGYLLTGNKKNE